MTQRRPRLRSPAGSVLVSTLLLLVLLLTLGASSLFVTNLDLQSTSHYKTGRQAFFAAESGIMHALSTMNARGVQDFRADIADPAQWARLYGTALKTMPDDPRNSYQITVAADPADPLNLGRISAIGLAPSEARRVLSVTIRKGILADQGALYLGADGVQADFGARDQFEIDGNDHKLLGSLNPSGPVKPGISTRNDTVTANVKDALSTQQKKKVRGLGFSLEPLKPSVWTTEGPSVVDLDQMVSNLLSRNPVVNVDDAVLPSGNYGTLAAPQVTHLTNKRVRLDGNMTGVGILIADGEFTINGNANFIGWIIIRGATVLNAGRINTGSEDDTLVDGNATIMGSLWTGDLIVHVGGSAIVDYCYECLALADAAGVQNNFPRAMAVASWQEVL